jgi:hypothetical protein
MSALQQLKRMLSWAGSEDLRNTKRRRKNRKDDGIEVQSSQDGTSQLSKDKAQTTQTIVSALSSKEMEIVTHLRRVKAMIPTGRSQSSTR